jgi:ABC-type thiamine transport system ATPase subunit
MLFDTILQIDLKAKKIKKKCIIYVGLTGVGKSTCFNWAARKILRGFDEDGRIIFKLLSKEGAEMAPGQIPVTLVFNEEEYDKETSLIDLTGWGYNED